MKVEMEKGRVERMSYSGGRVVARLLEAGRSEQEASSPQMKPAADPAPVSVPAHCLAVGS